MRQIKDNRNYFSKALQAIWRKAAFVSSVRQKSSRVGKQPLNSLFPQTSRPWRLEQTPRPWGAWSTMPNALCWLLGAQTPAQKQRAAWQLSLLATTLMQKPPRASLTPLLGEGGESVPSARAGSLPDQHVHKPEVTSTRLLSRRDSKGCPTGHVKQRLPGPSS